MNFGILLLMMCLDYKVLGYIGIQGMMSVKMVQYAGKRFNEKIVCKINAAE